MQNPAEPNKLAQDSSLVMALPSPINEIGSYNALKEMVFFDAKIYSLSRFQMWLVQGNGLEMSRSCGSHFFKTYEMQCV